jgi:hypothetical protein
MPGWLVALAARARSTCKNAVCYQRFRCQKAPTPSTRRRVRRTRILGRAHHAHHTTRHRYDRYGGRGAPDRQHEWRHERARVGGAGARRRSRTCSSIDICTWSVTCTETMSSFVQAATTTNRCFCVCSLTVCRCPARALSRCRTRGLRRSAGVRALRPPTRRCEAPPCAWTRPCLSPSLQAVC